jgi:hypothetical protein
MVLSYLEDEEIDSGIPFVCIGLAVSYDSIDSGRDLVTLVNGDFLVFLLPHRLLSYQIVQMPSVLCVTW